MIPTRTDLFKNSACDAALTKAIIPPTVGEAGTPLNPTAMLLTRAQLLKCKSSERINTALSLAEAVVTPAAHCPGTIKGTGVTTTSRDLSPPGTRRRLHSSWHIPTDQTGVFHPSAAEIFTRSDL